MTTCKCSKILMLYYVFAYTLKLGVNVLSHYSRYCLQVLLRLKRAPRPPIPPVTGPTEGAASLLNMPNSRPTLSPRQRHLLSPRSPPHLQCSQLQGVQAGMLPWLLGSRLLLAQDV